MFLIWFIDSPMKVFLTRELVLEESWEKATKIYDFWVFILSARHTHLLFLCIEKPILCENGYT